MKTAGDRRNRRLGSQARNCLPASTPITGDVLFSITPTTQSRPTTRSRGGRNIYGMASTPAPVRGALVASSASCSPHTSRTSALVTVEVGKITAEARGEVQEMIDVCQFSVGLSRQLYGRHRVQSARAPAWKPGIRWGGRDHAFNFPVAVWAWNTAVALVCGDTVVWKPSG